MCDLESITSLLFNLPALMCQVGVPAPQSVYSCFVVAAAAAAAVTIIIRIAIIIVIIIFTFFKTEFRSCYPGWSAMVQSQLTATSASWVQAILLPQPPE